MNPTAELDPAAGLDAVRLPHLSRLVHAPARFHAQQPPSPRQWPLPDPTVAELLRPADIDRLLGDGLPEAGKVRFFRASVRVAAGEFVRRRGSTEPGFTNYVDPRAVSRLLRDGCTLVLDALHRTRPPIGELCRGLSHETGRQVFAVGFLTPPGAPGLPPHHDTESVLLVQTFGTKTWRLHEPVLPDPLRHEAFPEKVDEAAKGAPAMTVVLHPGEALWIPRGWLHAATATDRPSLHITFGFTPLTRYELASTIVRQLDGRQEALRGLRRDLPWGIVDRPDELTRLMSDVVTEMKSALGTLDPSIVAAQVAREIRSTYPEPARPVPVTSALPGFVDAATLVVTVADAVRAAVRLDDDGRRLELPDTDLALCPAAAKLLEDRDPAVAGRPWCARDLMPDLDEPSAVRLVTDLLQEGLVRPAEPGWDTDQRDG
jgi:hypothetical protein